MAENSNYKVPHKRRRKQQTNYKRRKNLLKSGKPRAVVRTSNKHTKAHLSYYVTEGDENEYFVSTEELEKYGWEHHTGNLPAAYLAGYLLGTKAEENEAVLDIGLRQTKQGGRMYAAVKGMNDAGLNVPVGEQALPEEGRIRGEHIDEMKDTDIVENFENVKQKIEEDA